MAELKFTGIENTKYPPFWGRFCVWRPQGDYALILLWNTIEHHFVLCKWDKKELTKLHKIELLPIAIMDIAISPDGKTVLMVGDGTVIEYDCEKDTLSIHTMPEYHFRAVRFSPYKIDQVYMAGLVGLVVKDNVSYPLVSRWYNGTLAHTVMRRDLGWIVTTLDWSPVEKYFLWATVDGQFGRMRPDGTFDEILWWELDLPKPPLSPMDMDISPDGKYCYVAHYDGLTYWDIETKVASWLYSPYALWFRVKYSNIGDCALAVGITTVPTYFVKLVGTAVTYYYTPEPYTYLYDLDWQRAVETDKTALLIGYHLPVDNWVATSTILLYDKVTEKVKDITDYEVFGKENASPFQVSWIPGRLGER